ncbi:nodulation protein NolB [Methylobacterium aquaticum]|uniref:nodulation protein NolB n=1 Tax=Methylobacterium aquaticum TaxID=270351 RepID=UPI00069ED24D|nr:nodulation protein NolB [Methylobacterium aquaticum]
MAVEAVASGLGGVGGAGPVRGAEAVDFGPALGNAAGAAQNPAPSSTPPVREASAEPRAGGPDAPTRPVPAEVRASPRGSGDSIGHRVLDGLDRVQSGDVAWRSRPGPAGAAPDGPTLKVATRQPGPAESPMRPDAPRGPEIAGHPTTQPGQSSNPGFDGMMRQLEQVSGQVVQVSLVTKTTGSFTGSLNKLLSSG